MGVVLALASALAYGASDFLGGLLSRRVSPWLVAAVAQVASVIVLVIAALAVASDATGSDLWWGAASGVGSGAGTFFLYRGLGAGVMNVVAPLSAVGAALVPVGVGILTGERPGGLTWLGIACAFPAIWLVSRGVGGSDGDGGADPHSSTQARSAADFHDSGGDLRSGQQSAQTSAGSGVRDGLLAGAGFGLLFVALGQVPESAGLWPLAVGQGVAVVILVGGAALARTAYRGVHRAVLGGAVGVGLLAAAATALYQLAVRSQLVSVAAVLASLYPALTVLLAALVLKERVSRTQAVGLVLAAAAVALVAVPQD